MPHQSVLFRSSCSFVGGDEGLDAGKCGRKALAWANRFVQNRVREAANPCALGPRYPGVGRVYVPAAFSELDTAKLHEFMRRHSFAVLTSQGDGGLVASHLPILLDASASPQGHLLGHMARANPQWRRVAGEVMVVFSGPHAYVSPSWYEEGGTVPTWNYVAVHAYGTFHLVEDREDLLDILRRSVQTYEGSRPEPWAFDESAPHVEGLLRAIVGFRIDITRLEGKWKLSQNHSEERKRKVVRALADRLDEDSKAIADLMKERLR